MKILLFLFLFFATIFDSCRVYDMLIFSLSDYHSRPKFGERLVTNKEEDLFQFQEACHETCEKVCDFNYCSPFKNKKSLNLQLDDFLENHTQTTAFLVIHKDSILYENYFRGYDHQDIFPSWSIAKSFTGTLLGIAIEEGYIHSAQDLVKNYLPELEGCHEYWNELTLEHLLNMRSGFDYNELTYKKPKKGITNLYFSKNSIENIKKVDFDHKPGTFGKYSSLDTQVIGLVLERVLGKPLSMYLEEKIWTPLGMESEAIWNYESQKFDHTKAYCCIKATARDYAKLGRLYLNKGNWNGTQIVSEDWVEKATTPFAANRCYQYHWYMESKLKTEERDGEKILKVYDDSLQAAEHIDPTNEFVTFIPKERGYAIKQCGTSFFAAGVFEQRIFVDPVHELIYVRMGKKKDLKPHHLFNSITEHMKKLGTI